ncbi:hypothetical protein K6168_11315 [Streptomyces sp. FB2]|uniref:hypothetical protein n=1 Tax=Streptomyces sp. FB2 TaxID=2902454 RepID=UPI001F4790B1|nr:hypothetical protein [Streptomyces sp. FB2]MCF2536248.1 hypothetical protein [Streptomyces sp. FB2]
MLRVSSRLRVGGAFVYLLLVAVLTFGVFAMHTMGHPDHSSGTGLGSASHSAAGLHQRDEVAGVGPAAAPAAMTDHGDTTPVQSSAEHPMTGMDPLSVCVAVLTGWLLWSLLGASVRRKQHLTALLARALAVLPALPPPTRPLFAQLSVLRI